MAKNHRYLIVAVVVVIWYLAVLFLLPSVLAEQRYIAYWDGGIGIVSVDVSDADYAHLSDYRPAYTDAATYFRLLSEDQTSARYVRDIADQIQNLTPNRTHQAQAAITLAQGIRYYDDGGKTARPAEILYRGYGVCADKSILAAAILRELGINSALLHIPGGNHMVLGVGTDEGAWPDFRGTGYAFVEMDKEVRIGDIAYTNEHVLKGKLEQEGVEVLSVTGVKK